jgi:methylthioribose-1-phosphate isomerase
MKVNGKEMRSLWYDKGRVVFIDQRKLPYTLEFFTATTVEDIAFAIKDMVVRGAPAIGAAAVYGMVLGKNEMEHTAATLRKTRPTAHDLFHAIQYMLHQDKKGNDVLEAAHQYVEDIILRCKQIGEHGEHLIDDGMTLLTHCNAGALATVDYGTALAPMRLAFQKGKRLFVYADETRPRLQGILTDWELQQEGIPHAIIADNAVGYFMKKGDIDLVITGADRIAQNGDFANKIGTYEKAVLAREHDIPFYVAAPESTFDKSLKSGDDIPIEERGREELTVIRGTTIMPDTTEIRNPAFDVTPASFVTGFITENGIKRL